MFDGICDEELILRYRQGEKAVLDFLLEKYKNMVRTRARARFLAGGETDDLIQEGMIGLFRAVRDFEPEQGSSFRTFAQLCVDRQILAAVQRSNRKKHSPLNSSISLDAGEDSGKWVSGRAEDNPEDLVISRENAKSFAEMINGSLSSMEMRVLELYLEGNTYGEIAGKLGRTTKSVDNALKRIRSKIEKGL